VREDDDPHSELVETGLDCSVGFRRQQP
jgi:hypothetical protein